MAVCGIGLALWLSSGAEACSVPVFRYALERWPADPFEALVYCRGGLPQAEADLIAAAQDSRVANLRFRVVDLDKETSTDLVELLEEEETGTLPWLVLTYPRAYPYLGPVASGSVSVGLLESLADSPARRHLAERLTGGDTAVWILLESGDREKDARVAEQLRTRLAHLESTLELPTLEQEDIDAGLVSVTQDELRVAFSMLRVSRGDAAESVLVEMLLDSEEDLPDTQGPLVFPVFGRGRVLYALVGDGINAGTIDQAAEYIVGACSCQVKEQNPGVDLLMAVDWDAAIGSPQVVERDLPPLEGAGLLLDGNSAPDGAHTGDAGVSRPQASSGKTQAAPLSSSRWRALAGMATLLLVVLVAGSLLILGRNSYRK